MSGRSFLLSGEQIRAARAFARLEQSDLARLAGLSVETIKRLEGIRGPINANSRTLVAIVRACGNVGVEFGSSDDASSVKMVNRPG